MNRIPGLEQHPDLMVELNKVDKRLKEWETTDAAAALRRASEYITIQYALRYQKPELVSVKSQAARIKGLESCGMIKKHTITLWYKIQRYCSEVGAHFNSEEHTIYKNRRSVRTVVENDA